MKTGGGEGGCRRRHGVGERGCLIGRESADAAVPLAGAIGFVSGTLPILGLLARDVGDDGADAPWRTRFCPQCS